MGEKLRTRQRRRLRHTTLVLGSCLVLYCFLFVSRTPVDDGTSTTPKRLPPELLRNLSLDEEQCRATFPGLMKEIDDAVAEGSFTLKQMGDSGLQVRIKDGQLSIIHAQRRVDLSTEMLNSRTAALHQLHRALLTTPAPLPDTILSLNIQDQPFGTALTYSRPSTPPSPSPTTRNFLMPHFSFWSWPLPSVLSHPHAATAIAALESTLPFPLKIPKAIWRGTTWFNSIANPRLRQNLLHAARAQTWDWADIEAMNGNKSNALDIADFCRYKYVVHTEGITYSGRFQFLQMCASVTLTPALEWMQHTSHLVRPVFSRDLLAKKKDWMPSERVRRAWPVRYAAEEANIVFVAPDWSDLEDTIAWLEGHPDVAEGIARRQREMFVGGGYFSPAAEVCYWRALVRGWASVVRTEGEGWEDQPGVPFETFALTGGR